MKKPNIYTARNRNALPAW